MADETIVWFMLLFFTLGPLAIIVSIVSGWIFDWLEARRVRRILAAREAAWRDAVLYGIGAMSGDQHIPIRKLRPEERNDG